MTSAERMLVLWFPDWPVVAAAQELGLQADSAIALIDRGLVFASSRAARSSGVMRGLTQREAQYRCAGLTVVKYDQASDARRFEPVVRHVETLVPLVQVLRPGLLALRARGVARYFGGEDQAAEQLCQHVPAVGVQEVRIGIANGLFAAEQAARSSTVAQPVRNVPADSTAGFLSPLPVTTVSDDERTVTLLQRLGIHTLGDFAALSQDDVRRRFGASGVWSHLQAQGYDPLQWRPRAIPDDCEVVFESESALYRSDEVAFSIRESADRFDAQLRARKLVCTALEVQLKDEHGVTHTRTWLHPRWFRPSEIVDRVRWQLDGLFGSKNVPFDDRVADDGFEQRGIIQVVLRPERLDPAAHHEPGLWGGGPDERVHHALTRVQSLLGAEAVGTLVLSGGRAPSARSMFVPWGEPLIPRHDPLLPWPGNIPGVPPATVHQTPIPILVLDAEGNQVIVTSRGLLSAGPAQVRERSSKSWVAVQAWSQPWTEAQRWWDQSTATRVARIQLVDDQQRALLLMWDGGGWAIEAEYD